MEHWLPLFYERLETLFDYLPARRGARHQARAARRARRDDRRLLRRAPELRRRRGGAAPAYRPLRPAQLYLDEAEWNGGLANGRCASHARSARRGRGEVFDAGGAARAGISPRARADEASTSSRRRATTSAIEQGGQAGRRRGIQRRLRRAAEDGAAPTTASPEAQPSRAGQRSRCPSRRAVGLVVLRLERGYERRCRRSSASRTFSATAWPGRQAAGEVRQIPRRGLHLDAGRPRRPYRARNRPL